MSGRDEIQVLWMCKGRGDVGYGLTNDGDIMENWSFLIL